MRNFGLLLKLQMDGIFRFSEFRYAKGTEKKLGFLLRSFIPLALAVLLYFGCYFLGQSLVQVGLTDAIPLIGYVLGSILTLVFTIIKINELLAGDDNAQFLLSLPIGTFWHVFLIFLRLYVESTVLVLLTNVPLIQGYGAATDLPGGFWGRWMVGVFFTCLPITGIASLVGVFLALILCTIKNSNLFHSLITLSVLFGMGVLVCNAVGKAGQVMASTKDPSEIIHSICVNYSFGRMYQRGVMENSGAYFFLFLIASSVWFLFFFLFMVAAYQEIVLALRAPKVYKKFEFGLQKAKTREKALEQKSWSQWIHSRSYMVSTLIGPMYAIMLSVFCLVKPHMISGVLIKYFDTTRSVESFVVVCGILLALIGMGCSSYCGYSIEGKRHWIRESAPMGEGNLGKYIVKRNLCITLPVAVIGSVCLAVAFSFGVLKGALLLLVAVAYCFATAVWGIRVDEKFADYSMMTENQILRQSTSFFLGWMPAVALPVAVIVAVIVL